MANLQMLRKRLKSINATGEMASAMKTVASVKYSKLSKIASSFSEYSDSCAKILDLIADAAFKREDSQVEKRNCFVVVSSNRGFCGVYNATLFKFLETESGKASYNENPLYIACGKKSQTYLEEHQTRAIPFNLSDIPTIEEARALTEMMLDIYRKGEAESIHIIYQRFVNMMVQKPTDEQILPRTGDENKEEEDILFLPDRETFSSSLALDCLTSRVYGILLSAASGAQSSTVIAMKSACDNASESSQNLEMTINRLRQAEVTNSVIETSSGMAASQNMER